MRGKRGGGGLPVCTGYANPVTRAEKVCELRLRHELGAGSQSALVEIRVLRDARAYHAGVESRFHDLSVEDDLRTGSHERSRRGSRGIRPLAGVYDVAVYDGVVLSHGKTAEMSDAFPGFTKPQNADTTETGREGRKLHDVLCEYACQGESFFPEASDGVDEVERETDEREATGYYPETDDDLRLRPALLLEVMVYGCHEEHALPRELEIDHLDENRAGLHDEQTTDDEEKTSESVMTATHAKAVPSAREPVSPMNISAG